MDGIVRREPRRKHLAVGARRARGSNKFSSGRKQHSFSNSIAILRARLQPLYVYPPVDSPPHIGTPISPKAEQTSVKIQPIGLPIGTPKAIPKQNRRQSDTRIHHSRPRREEQILVCPHVNRTKLEVTCKTCTLTPRRRPGPWSVAVCPRRRLVATRGCWHCARAW